MEIEIVSTLDKKTFTDYMMFNFTHRRYFKYFVILLIAALLMIIATIITSIVKGIVTFNTFLPLIVLVVMVIIYAGLFYFSANHAYKQNKTVSNNKIRYFFNDDYLFINESKKDIFKGVRVKYNQLFSVYENKKYFYLYVDQTRSYILPKKDIIKGNYLDLRNHLRSKIVCVYNQKCK